MRATRHIDRLLRDWPYDANRIGVRIVKGADDRRVLQLRVDLGLLQLEMTGRPDGSRPAGEETYLAYLQREALFCDPELGDDFIMSPEQCSEVDREFVQFYHRRICWLALKEYEKAKCDADHTLALMDFCREHSPDAQWTMAHEQHRPFVLFHRIQAAALADLQGDDELGPEAAIYQLNLGLNQLYNLFVRYEAEEQYADDDLVQRLIEMRESLRKKYGIDRTLDERLTDAIAREQYELAARLRDEMARRAELVSRRGEV